MTDTTTTPEPFTVTLPYTSAILAGAYAVALHTSKDDVTPIICTVRVSPRYFMATDRYSVGRFEHTPEGDDGEAVMVPRAAMEWLTKQSPKALGKVQRDSMADVRVTFTSESVTLEEGEQTLAVQRFAPVAGTFPPVGRLVDGAEAATDGAAVNLNPRFMERFTKGAARVLEPHGALRMEFTKTANPDKPGPVIFSFGAFKGLLQPNLILR